MDSEKNISAVKWLGVVSILLFVIVVGFIIFITKSSSGVQRSMSAEQLNDESNTPEITRNVNQRDMEILYAASELARSKELAAPIHIGEELEGSPGVYSVNVYELGQAGTLEVDGFGQIINSEIDATVDSITISNDYLKDVLND